MERVRCQVASPIDELTLIAEGDALVGVRFASGSGRRWFRNDDEIRIDDAHPVLVRARRQLAEYFAGERTEFDLPLSFSGDEFRRARLDRAADDPVRRNGQLWRRGRGASATVGWPSRSVRPSAPTRWRSSSHATGWSAATGR